MNINIDFLLSGCNTRCKHCYVNGGPGPLMNAEDALICIEKLDALAAFLHAETSFTLDHEPMNHPHLERILDAAAQTQHIVHYHHGMTTGVGLMARKDSEDVVQAYLRHGYQTFGITLHGSASHHDEIVCKSGAYEKALASAAFFKQHGAKIEVSLMFNRFFPQDAEALNDMLETLKPDYLHFAIPIFTPHANMRVFEPYRGDLDDLRTLEDYLPGWNASGIIRQAERHTIAATIAALKSGLKLREEFRIPQDELYLTLHQNCSLYVGNSGAETEWLCDLRTADPKKLAEKLGTLPANRDWGAFYDPDVLPPEEALISALESLPQKAVYGDRESTLYRGLDALQTPTRILPLGSCGS